MSNSFRTSWGDVDSMPIKEMTVFALILYTSPKTRMTTVPGFRIATIRFMITESIYGREIISTIYY